MITGDQAVDAAVDYLTGGLRRRLRAIEGWPGEPERLNAGEQKASSPPHAASTDLPELPQVSRSQKEFHKPLSIDARSPIEGLPRRVWSVRVSDDGRHVGSSTYLVIDADTGRVVTTMRWGE